MCRNGVVVGASVRVVVACRLVKRWSGTSDDDDDDDDEITARRRVEKCQSSVGAGLVGHFLRQGSGG